MRKRLIRGTTLHWDRNADQLLWKRMIDTGDSGENDAAAPASEVTDSSRKDQGMAEAPLSRLRH